MRGGAERRRAEEELSVFAICRSLDPSSEIFKSPSGVERSMIEIIMTLVLAVLLAKRKPSRRRRFNLRMVRINNRVAMGALDTLTVTSGSITTAANDTYRLMSVKASYSWTDIAAVADDGFTFGLAHSDYTSAEIEECLESQSSIDLGNKVAQEQANRLVREIGTIRSTPGATIAGSAIFGNGRLVKTRLNWAMNTGDTLNVWVHNASNVIWTTGSNLNVAGAMWIKDNI